MLELLVTTSVYMPPWVVSIFDYETSGSIPQLQVTAIGMHPPSLSH